MKASSRDEVKRRAARLLTQAGRRHLQPLGVVQDGRSPRRWTADRGWWLVNVEFQPSAGRIGAYLNVGLQHLWFLREHRIFEYSSRQMIEGHKQFVDLSQEDASAADAADALGRSAHAAVAEWLARLADDGVHLAWLTGYTTDLWNAVNAAFARAALGERDQAAQLFLTVAEADGDSELPWRQHRGAECAALADLAVSGVRFDAEVERRIDGSRKALRLPER